jgi:hypothetical protein
MRQVWKGGATDLGTRTVIPDPPRWLVLGEQVPMETTVSLLSWKVSLAVPGSGVITNHPPHGLNRAVRRGSSRITGFRGGAVLCRMSRTHAQARSPPRMIASTAGRRLCGAIRIASVH